MGHVGKDPEVRRLDNNLVVARFTLATTERWNKDGNWVEHVEWHNIILWRGLAERVEKHVRKGTAVYIEGRLRSSSYDDKDGVKRYVTEVLADVVHFPRPETLQTAQQKTEQPVEPAVAPEAPAIEDTGSEPVDDLPF